MFDCEDVRQYIDIDQGIESKCHFGDVLYYRVYSIILKQEVQVLLADDERFEQNEGFGTAKKENSISTKDSQFYVEQTCTWNCVHTRNQMWPRMMREQEGREVNRMK